MPDTDRSGGGAALVMAAAVLWGTTGTAQALASYDGSALPLGSARLVVASLILAGIAAARRVSWRHAFASRRTTAIVLLGAVCVATYQPAFFFGVQRTGVAVGTLTAIGSAPIFAGLGTLLTGQRLSRVWWLSTATVLLGLGLLLRVEGALRFDAAGLAACLVAGASYAAYTATSRSLLAAGMPPTGVITFLFAGGATLLFVAAPVANTTWLAEPHHLYLAVYLGVVATALPYLIWVAGLRSVRTSTAATLSLTEPLTAALLGWLVLREPLTATGLVGAGLVLAGLAVTAISRSPVPGSSP